MRKLPEVHTNVLIQSRSSCCPTPFSAYLETGATPRAHPALRGSSIPEALLSLTMSTHTVVYQSPVNMLQLHTPTTSCLRNLTFPSLGPLHQGIQCKFRRATIPSVLKAIWRCAPGKQAVLVWQRSHNPTSGPGMPPRHLDEPDPPASRNWRFCPMEQL